MNWRDGLMVGLLGALLGGGAMLLAAPATVGGSDQVRTEAVVRDYILGHPEIIQQAALKLRDRELGKVVTANHAAFETPYAGAFAGNPKGDVTLVEFFDYACGYCRASVPVIDRLVREDKLLRVVYRELPVLGPNSEAAAYASLAAARQPGKYNGFHHALFAAGRPEPETLARVAGASGVAIGAQVPGARAEIGKNLALAGAIGVQGTPGFIVGDRVFTGAVGYDVLKSAIAEARAGRS